MPDQDRIAAREAENAELRRAVAGLEREREELWEKIVELQNELEQIAWDEMR